MAEFGETLVLGAGDFPAALRFSTQGDAELCRQKLIERLPGTDTIWTIAQEVQTPEWARI
jgi:hypothetical protein